MKTAAQHTYEHMPALRGPHILQNWAKPIRRTLIMYMYLLPMIPLRGTLCWMQVVPEESSFRLLKLPIFCQNRRLMLCTMRRGCIGRCLRCPYSEQSLELSLL